jgi:hypothetical protein
MISPEIRKSMKSHQAKLAGLIALPDDQRDWQVRGSIDYHSDCIRFLRIIAEEQNEHPCAD